MTKILTLENGTIKESEFQNSIPTGVPVSLGLANAEGVSESFSRSDHVHLDPVIEHQADPDPHPQYLTSNEIIQGSHGIQITGSDTRTISGQFALYNSSGLIGSETKIKQWVGTVVSDGSGDFTVNWSSAGFTQPPFNVMVTAFTPTTDTVVDRAWATMRLGFTNTQGQGYTLRGNTIITLLIGGAATIRTAPNVIVHVVALGV